jgi:hypothetical protein
VTGAESFFYSWIRVWVYVLNGIQISLVDIRNQSNIKYFRPTTLLLLPATCSQLPSTSNIIRSQSSRQGGTASNRSQSQSHQPNNGASCTDELVLYLLPLQKSECTIVAWWPRGADIDVKQHPTRLLEKNSLHSSSKSICL